MDLLKTINIIEVLEGFLEYRRPPEEIRDKVDIDYRIEDQSILIFEIRPVWTDPGRYIERGIAKATYIKSKDHWKIFWMRSDMKWHGYEPYPTAKKIEEFISVVSEDERSCFWG